MEIILKPQEENTNSKFAGQVFLTRNFISTFKCDAFAIAIHAIIKIKKDRVPNGADYFQALKYNNVSFWVIDDIDHVTVLMPEDY